MPLTLRNRLEYRIIRRDTPEKSKRGLSIDYFSDMAVRAEPKLKILNDIVIDRGTSSSMVELNCYVDTSLITTVHADGLIIATPTGSTAYSMSAGGSMVHPLTPGMLMTPICPHTLSFRQMLFPDSTVLRMEVAMDSRCPASVSFDGQFKEVLNHGDMLIVSVEDKVKCRFVPPSIPCLRCLQMKVTMIGSARCETDFIGTKQLRRL